VHGARVECELAAFDAGDVQRAFDQRQQMVAAAPDDADRLPTVFRNLGVGIENLGVAEDAVERRAQLVGERADMAALGLVSEISDLLGLLERQFPVLDERRRMVIPSGPDESPAKSRNVADCKVWLPRVMKDDLAFLAQAESVTLSRYVRNVIITHLTGHAGLADHSPINRSLHAPSTVRIRKNRGTLDQ